MFIRGPEVASCAVLIPRSSLVVQQFKFLQSMMLAGLT